jgi:sugar lactone lactonase YvrE
MEMRAEQRLVSVALVAAITAILPSSFAECEGMPWSDLDGDGVVGQSDLGILLADWNCQCPNAWEPDEHTVALWYLNGNGRDESENGNDLIIKNDRVGWIDDAPHCKGVLMGADPWEGGCENSDGGALTAPGSGCAYPGSGDWTVEAWVYFPSATETYHVVYHYSQRMAGHDPYLLDIANGVARFEIRDSDDNIAFVEADVSALEDTWFHLAGVYRYQQDLALWVNESRVAIVSTGSVPETLMDCDVYVGGSYCGTSTALKIDEVRLSNTMRCVCEMFVCSGGNNNLVRFDGYTGDCIEPPNLDCDLDNPSGMVLGPDGRLYMCSSADNRIVWYDPVERTCDDFASDGPLNAPISLTFGPDGNLYVANYLDYQVVSYWPNGEVAVEHFLVDDPDNPIDLPASPIDLVFGPDGNLYITSAHEGPEWDCVKCYDGTTGEYLGDFVSSGAGGLNHPNGLRFGADGYLYVCSGLTDQVLRYDANGTHDPTCVFGPEDGLNGPRYLEFGPDGMLYVTNLYSDNVTRYDVTMCEFIDIFASDCGLDAPRGLVFRCVD